jgi:tetratricopeptide (TPR) repeat protein
LLLAACGSTPSVPDEKAEAVAPPSESTAATASAPTAPAEAPAPAEAVQQFDRALALMSGGDVAGAERALGSLAAAYPTYSGPMLNLGILHAKAGRLEQAEQAFKGAVERNANNAVAFNQLGVVYRRLGRFKEADEAYQRAVQIDPSYALAYLNLGVLCDLYLQQPQRALEAYERYLSLAAPPDPKVSAWVTELKARLGNATRSANASEP